MTETTDAMTDSTTETETVCGDGEQQGDEECDDGKDNADNAACKSDCTKNTCGDGHVHTGVEECEPDNNNPNGCIAGCKFERRIVFVTAGIYQPGTDFDSVTSADEKCQAAAKAAGLNGTFRAWLGVQSGQTSQSPTKDWGLTGFMGRFILNNDQGTVVAEGWNGLTSGSLKHAISIDENKKPASGSVWTGLKPDGTPLTGRLRRLERDRWFQRNPR
jgi:hypothetical protein